MSRVAHKPTTQSRNMVKVGLTCGLEIQQIAAQLGISQPTLRKHYPVELQSGKDAVHLRVAGNMIQKAMSDRKDAVVAGKFILERRFGWNPPRVQMEHAGAGGGPIQTIDLTKATDEQLTALEAVFGPLALASGSDSGGDGGENAT